MTRQNNRIAALAVAFAMAGGASQGATYTASKVIEDGTSYGSCTGSASACAANQRQVVGNALGDTDGKFYSLGLGGSLTVGFDQVAFGSGASVTLEEVTFGGPQAGQHFEALDIYAVLGGMATFVQTVYNAATSTTVQIAQGFNYIRLIDATQREYSNTSSFDGYDVDSIKVTVAPVPIPAAGGFLLAGLGGLALLRRRKAAC